MPDFAGTILLVLIAVLATLAAIMVCFGSLHHQRFSTPVPVPVPPTPEPSARPEPRLEEPAISDRELRRMRQESEDLVEAERARHQQEQADSQANMDHLRRELDQANARVELENAQPTAVAAPAPRSTEVAEVTVAPELPTTEPTPIQPIRNTSPVLARGQKDFRHLKLNDQWARFRNENKKLADAVFFEAAHREEPDLQNVEAEFNEFIDFRQKMAGYPDGALQLDPQQVWAELQPMLREFSEIAKARSWRDKSLAEMVLSFGRDKQNFGAHRALWDSTKHASPDPARYKTSIDKFREEVAARGGTLPSDDAELLAQIKMLEQARLEDRLKEVNAQQEARALGDAEVTVDDVNEALEELRRTNPDDRKAIEDALGSGTPADQLGTVGVPIINLGRAIKAIKPASDLQIEELHSLLVQAYGLDQIDTSAE